MPSKTPNNKELDKLLEAFTALQTTDEVLAFLSDLCTPREIEDMAQRLLMAEMLDSGFSYTYIQEATGASATTVARVSRALNYGSGGYKAALRREQESNTDNLDK